LTRKYGAQKEINAYADGKNFITIPIIQALIDTSCITNILMVIQGICNEKSTGQDDYNKASILLDEAIRLDL